MTLMKLYLKDLKGDLSARQALDKAYEQVKDQMTKEEYLTKMRDVWNQSIVDNSTLTQAIDIQDPADEDLNRVWNKVAGW